MISGGPKIKRSRALRASKSVQKAILKTQWFRGRLRTSMFSKINDFWRIFGGQNGAKIQIKRIKIDVEKQHVFGDDFSSKFIRFGLRKWIPNPRFAIPLQKTPILQKSLFFLRKIAIFEVRSLKKQIENRCKNAIENNIEKKDSKIRSGLPFWLPKTSKIAPQSDAKRSWFRDAMDLARKSLEVNGGRRL